MVTFNDGLIKPACNSNQLTFLAQDAALTNSVQSNNTTAPASVATRTTTISTLGGTTTPLLPMPPAQPPVQPLAPRDGDDDYEGLPVLLVGFPDYDLDDEDLLNIEQDEISDELLINEYKATDETLLLLNPTNPESDTYVTNRFKPQRAK